MITLLKNMGIKDVDGYVGLLWDMVKEIHGNHLHHKFGLINIRKIKHISIDKFAIQKGHIYLTTVVDMDSDVICYVFTARELAPCKTFGKR